MGCSHSGAAAAGAEYHVSVESASAPSKEPTAKTTTQKTTLRSDGWGVLPVAQTSPEWKMLSTLFQVTDPDALGIGRDVAIKVVDNNCNRTQLYNGLAPVLAWKIATRRRTIYEAQVEMLQRDVDQLRPVCELQHVGTKLDAAAQPIGLNEGINEHILLHGTKPSNLISILRSGLNERVSSGHFGNGVYLTEDPSKSDQYCTPDVGTDDLIMQGLYDSCGVKHPGNVYYAFVCRVALGVPLRTKNGVYSLDRAGMSLYATKDKRELAAIPGSQPPICHHSLVVLAGPRGEGYRLQRHREFLVFNSNSILEEYVIAYQRTLDGVPVDFPAELVPQASTSMPRSKTAESVSSMSSVDSPQMQRMKQMQRMGTGSASVTSTSSRLTSKSSKGCSNLKHLIRDAMASTKVTAVVKDQVLHISGSGPWDCFNGKRGDAPLLWMRAPQGGAPLAAGAHTPRARPECNWTATVKCRFEAASDFAAALFTVYDGPDGSGHIAFAFGPRTLGEAGVGYQPMHSEEFTGDTGLDPFQWHELRIQRYSQSEQEEASRFDLSYRPVEEFVSDSPDAADGPEEPLEEEWIQVATAVEPFKKVAGRRIAVGLRLAQSGKSEVLFKDLKVAKTDD